MIDAFSHFLPPEVLARMREIAPQHPALGAFSKLPELWDLDARIRSLATTPGVRQILNFGNPPVETFGSPEIAAQLARLANECMARIRDTHPDLFPGFTAVLPMSDPDLALRELDYAHDQLGARGIQIYTNVLGAPLSEERYRPIFRAMAGRDLPVLVHPYRTKTVADYPTEEASDAEVWFTFGWPYETSAFAARMVFSGIFDELPDLKIVLHHFGGMIPAFARRIALGFEQIFEGVGGANPVALRAGISEPVIDHYHRFYADTAVNGSNASVYAGYDFFGAEHSVFGSDAPFCPDGGHSFVMDSLASIDALDLSPEDYYAITEGNARILFNLPDDEHADAVRQTPAEVAR